MINIFSTGFYITTKGEELLAKAQTGVVLTFTRMAIGSGFPTGASLKDQLDLTNTVTDLPIVSLSSVGNTCTVKGHISNDNWTTNITYREIGLFATDGTNEILYAYNNAYDNPEILPQPSSGTVINRLEAMAIAIDNTINVTATIIPITNAVDVNYSNSTSGLAATNVQAAIDELLLQIPQNNLSQSISDRIGYPADAPNWVGQTVFSIIKFTSDKFQNMWTDIRAGYIDAIKNDTTSIIKNTNGIKVDTTSILNGEDAIKADTANISVINTKIGTNADVSGTTTVFAWFAKLYDYLITNLSPTRTAKIDDIYAMLLASNTFYKASDTIQETIQGISLAGFTADYPVIAVFTPKHDGMIKINLYNDSTRTSAYQCLIMTGHYVRDVGETYKLTETAQYNISNGTMSTTGFGYMQVTKKEWISVKAGMAVSVALAYQAGSTAPIVDICYDLYQN